MISEMWYLRMFERWSERLPESINSTSKQGYREYILSAHDVLKEIELQVKIDCVELDTGRVARHDYKKPLPKWLEDPLIRQIAATTGKVP